MSQVSDLSVLGFGTQEVYMRGTLLLRVDLGPDGFEWVVHETRTYVGHGEGVYDHTVGAYRTSDVFIAHRFRGSHLYGEHILPELCKMCGGTLYSSHTLLRAGEASWIFAGAEPVHDPRSPTNVCYRLTE